MDATNDDEMAATNDERTPADVVICSFVDWPNSESEKEALVRCVLGTNALLEIAQSNLRLTHSIESDKVRVQLLSHQPSTANHA